MWYILVYRVKALELYSFFFQAEDGIRDWSVTGVQTCALPIYHEHQPMALPGMRLMLNHRLMFVVQFALGLLAGLGLQGILDFGRLGSLSARIEDRSEERRVGRVSRCREARGLDRRIKRVVMLK